MAKVSFDARFVPVPRGADPEPLLKEIAAYLRREEPVPLHLADWYCRMLEGGRIRISRVPGVKHLDSDELQMEVIERLRHLPSDGILKAIEDVRADLKVQATTRTVQGWLREIHKAQKEADEWAMSSHERFAKSEFRRLAEEEIVGAAALKHMLETLETAQYPSLEGLKTWQMAADQPEASDPGVRLESVWGFPSAKD